MKATIEARGTVVRVLRIASHVLIVAGLCGIVYVGWAYFDGMRYQAIENQRFEAELAAAPAARPGPSGDSTPGSPARPSPRLLTAPDPQSIGRLEIPRLKLSVMIREGVDSKSLRRAAGHVPQTALPGEPGNFVVAAHRDTLFRPLRDIRQGDAIDVRTLHGTFHYVVDSILVVAPDYLSVMEPASGTNCTLITCYPFDFIGPAPRRFIVRAKAN